MKLDLNKPFDVNKFNSYSKKLIDSKSKVELKEVRQRRTISQNSYLHTILSIYAINFGETLEDTKQNIFKVKVNRELFLKSIDVDGELIKFIRSSSDLDTLELTTAIDRFRTFSSSNGCYIPSPEEYRLNQFEIDKEIESANNFI